MITNFNTFISVVFMPWSLPFVSFAACFWGFPDVVKALLEDGTGVSECTSFVDQFPALGEKRLPRLKGLHNVQDFGALGPRISWLNKLIFETSQGVTFISDVNAQNKGTMWTPLHAASFQEHGKVQYNHGPCKGSPPFLDNLDDKVFFP